MVLDTLPSTLNCIQSFAFKYLHILSMNKSILTDIEIDYLLLAIIFILNQNYILLNK